MTFLKVASCLLVLVVVSCASTVPKGGTRKAESNIVDCDDFQTTDVRLLHKTVQRDGKFWQIVRETVTFPESGPGLKEITCIIVTDNVHNGNGGHPTILDGGVGFKRVIIGLESQRSKGFEFMIEIWGR